MFFAFPPHISLGVARHYINVKMEKRLKLLPRTEEPLHNSATRGVRGGVTLTKVNHTQQYVKSTWFNKARFSTI